MEESGKPVTCCRCRMILGRRGDRGLGHDEQSGCVKYWDISYADMERMVSKRACRFDDCRTTLQLDFVSIANPWDSDADRSPQHGRLTDKDFWAHGSMIFDVGRLSKKAGLANWFDSSSPGSRLATMVAYNTERNQFSKLTPPRQALMRADLVLFTRFNPGDRRAAPATQHAYNHYKRDWVVKVAQSRR